MNEELKLLNLKEVSRILSVNTEVLRRWLRSGRMPGVKVGSDWRVNIKDLEPFLNGGQNSESSGKNENEPREKNQQKMCFRFPKWLEFSGLPGYLNKKLGPSAWPVFKKLIELDFELGKPADRTIELNIDELAERVGYEASIVEQLVKKLEKLNYITLSRQDKKKFYSIVTPLKTPRLILDVPYSQGGIKGAPTQALTNSCLRRFLESEPME